MGVEELSDALGVVFGDFEKEVQSLKGEQAKVLMTLVMLHKVVDAGGARLQKLEERLEALAKAAAEGRLEEFLEGEGEAPPKQKPKAAAPDPALLSYWVDDVDDGPDRCYCPKHNVMKLKRDITRDMEGHCCVEDDCGSVIDRGTWVLPPKQT